MLDPAPAAGLEPDEKKGGDHMSDIKGEYGLFIDYEYCSGCNACLTACKMEHDMPESDFGIRIFQDGPVQSRDGSWHRSRGRRQAADLRAPLPERRHGVRQGGGPGRPGQGRPEGQDRHLRAVSPSLHHESDGPAARVQLGLFDR